MENLLGKNGDLFDEIGDLRRVKSAIAPGDVREQTKDRNPVGKALGGRGNGMGESGRKPKGVPHMKVGRRKTIIEGDGRRLQRRRSVYKNGVFRTGGKRRRERRRADLFGEKRAGGIRRVGRKTPKAHRRIQNIREKSRFIPFHFRKIRAPKKKPVGFERA